MLKALRSFLGGPNRTEPARARLTFAAATFSEIFSIGDVHGCLDELVDAEQRIRCLPDLKEGRRLIVLLGDYVDRGPASSGVLDHLLRPPPLGFERICICGNHDEAFHNFVASPRFDGGWLDFGGVATLRSYGVDAAFHLKLDPSGRSLVEAARAQIPDEHVEFAKDAPVALCIGHLIFVHAGVRPGIPLDQQTDADLMWIREPFLSIGSGDANIVIHGHTPSEKVTFGNNRIGLDVGAYMTGRLSVLRINSDGFTML